MDFITLRKQYQELSFDRYTWEWKDEALFCSFYYRLHGEKIISFCHSLCYEWKEKDVLKTFVNTDPNALNTLLFQIGIAESINYWKTACPKKLRICCGRLTEEQAAFWKKLYFHGLGEFIYLNRIHHILSPLTPDVLVEIESEGKTYPTVSSPKLKGSLIPVGGGKDSVVTLELLKHQKEQNLPFVMSPPQAAYDCIEIAGYVSYCLVTRKLDRQILTMNQEGYLNGHVPFSAILAFIASLAAYLTGKKDIALSNEKSANEPSVVGTTFNHQYSKTLEFERDFSHYFSTYGIEEISYFSLLRGMYEIEIAKLFAGYSAYHAVFRSCNRGKKENAWCGVCSKCLFVYCMLAPFLPEEELVAIYGKNLWEDESLLPILRELAGLEKTKPFECVGTIWEVRYALAKMLEAYRDCEKPFLLREYEKFGISFTGKQLSYEEGDCIPPSYQAILQAQAGDCHIS